MNPSRTRPPLAAAAVLLGFCVPAAPAQTNFALDFDGVDDYAEIGDSLSLTGPLTLEAWVLVRSGTNPSTIVANMFGTGYALDVWDDGSSVVLRLAFDGVVRGQADFMPYLGTWTHVAATWGGSGTGTDLYINGARAGGSAFAGTLGASTQNLRLGSRPGTSTYLDGVLDEVRIWSAKVDGPTLQSWMSSVPTAAHPDFASLEGYWRFDEGSGQSAASEVGPPALTGRLGATSSAEASDPAWTAGPTSVRPMTLGRLKAMYRR